MTRSRVYSRFRMALRNGVIKRLDSCENCGASKENATIMGHHEDYSQPQVITWLCGSCHQLLHNMKDPGRIERMLATRKLTRGLSLKEYRDFYEERRA